MAATNVVIVGAAGRMGRMLVLEVLKDSNLALTGALEVAGCPLAGQDAAVVAGVPKPIGVPITTDPKTAFANADVAVIFANDSQVAMELSRLGASLGLALVIGSTGLSADDLAGLDALAANGARIVQSPNMSVGVNLLFALCAKVAPLLGRDYDIEVVEMHHNQKKDAPSGTADKLGRILAEARGLDYETAVRHGRNGIVGARTKDEIGMHALRGGDVVGDHTVIFATEGERIELTHKASSRQTFAKGAMRAAKFLMTVPAGRYDMQDVLGLR